MTPESFRRAISFDPLLNLRRGEVSGGWVVERKATVPVEELGRLTRRDKRLCGWVHNPPLGKVNPKHLTSYINVHESLISGKRGYRVILMPNELNQHVYNSLCQSDLQRYGGYAAFADALEQQEERREEDLARQMSNKRKALNGEVFDIMRHVNNKKWEKLDQGETDLRYLLHGKRTQQGDKPLVSLTDM